MKELKNEIVVNSEGWYWPKNDGFGNFEGEGSCWKYMKNHPNVPKQITEYVPKKQIVVQAGGNCGYYVKQYASLFEIVYTFEPDPVNFYCLNLNVTDENVLKFQGCLGNNRQAVTIGNYMSDVGAGHITGVGGAGVIPMFRIDDLGLPDCDLIHLDIEGFELMALMGATETIKKYKPVVALEYFDAWAKRYNTSLEGIEEFLNQLGYQFVADEDGDRVYKFEQDTNQSEDE